MKKINTKTHAFIFPQVILFLCFASFAMAQEGSLESDSVPVKPDVIHVAYGTQNLNAVTSAISTVKFDSLKGHVSNWGQAISGRLPGFNLGNIRGYTQQGGSGQPLIIVDGFRSNLDFLSFNEVASVSVLKDASATALYGMDAANGVILVTTRRGSTGQKNVTINVDTWTSVLNKTADLLNAGEYAGLRNQAVINDHFYNVPGSYNLPFPDAANYDGQHDHYRYPDNNYLQELFNPVANSVEASMRVDGGTKRIRYMFSGNYAGSTGYFNSDLTNLARTSTQNFGNSFTVRGNVDSDITKNLTVSTDVKFALSASNYPNTSPINDALILAPQAFPLYNPDSSLGASVQDPQRNPIAQLAYSGNQKFMSRGVETNLRARYSLNSLVQGLSVEVRGALDSWFRLLDARSTKLPTYIYDTVNQTYTLSIDQQDLEVVTWNNAPYNNNQRRTLESSVNYSKTIKSDHQLDMMLMTHYNQYELSYDYYKFKNLGYGLRTAYGLRQKYFVELTAGYYGTEAFKKGYRFALFPAAAASWILSKEEFMRGFSKTLNHLKIRASYGMTGGTGFAAADMGRLYTSGVGTGTAYGYYLNDRIYYNQYYNSNASSTVFGKVGGDLYSAGAGARQDRLASIVTWDKSYKSNFGLEVTLWNSLNLKLDLFQDKRIGFLTQSVAIVPFVSGVNDRVPFNNAGTNINKGFELSLEYYKNKPGFSYAIMGNVWYNKSVIFEQASIDVNNPTITRNGRNIMQLYGYQTDGFYSVNTPEGTNQGFGAVVPGDIKYIDQNGDGIINALDLIPLGNPALSMVNYSLSCYLNYRGIFLDIMVIGNGLGSRFMSGFEVPFNQPFQNAYSYAKDSWTPQTADQARYPRLSDNPNTNNSQPSDLWLISTDRVDLSYVKIGYEIPMRTKKEGKPKQNLVAFFQSSSPLSWLKYDNRTYTSSPWYKSYMIGLKYNY